MNGEVSRISEPDDIHPRSDPHPVLATNNIRKLLVQDVVYYTPGRVEEWPNTPCAYSSDDLLYGLLGA